MKNSIKKVINLSAISYPWLLLISMLIFLASLYYGKQNPQITLIIEWITYGAAILSAVIWGILNYIDHIKLGANYRKYNDIEVYVNNLIMSKDERVELKTYLEDYSKDLMSQGKTKEESIKIAIDQFRVQEFTSISKNNSIINLPIHYYLIGYTMIAGIAAFILQILTNILFANSFWLLAIEFMFVSYGVGFIGLFFLYKLMDTVLSKKISN